MSNVDKVKITLVKSTANANKKQVATVQALGLRKIGQSIEREATPALMGMVNVVAHLVSCDKI